MKRRIPLSKITWMTHAQYRDFFRRVCMNNPPYLAANAPEVLNALAAIDRLYYKDSFIPDHPCRLALTHCNPTP